MAETMNIFSPKILGKIKNIISLSLQRAVPQVNNVELTIKENYRKDKYLYIETNTFQSNPIMFKTLYIDGSATPYCENEEAKIVKLYFNFNFRWVAFNGGSNGIDLGRIEIDIVNGHVRVPDGFIYAMNFQIF